MANPGQNLNELIEASTEEIKKNGHEYTLIEDKDLISEKTEVAKKLIEKHNIEQKNIEKVILSITKQSKDFLGERKVEMKDIVGTCRVELEHLTWRDSLIFLQQYTSFLPLEELNVPKFLEKMQDNDFAETLKLIEHPKDSGEYYVLDGTNRVVLAKNLGLDYIKAEIYTA
ncbi:MAG: hypothetical protein ACRCTZ_16705 [Sarcina sp.]